MILCICDDTGRYEIASYSAIINPLARYSSVSEPFHRFQLIVACPRHVHH